jgi:hypothetical protein
MACHQPLSQGRLVIPLTATDTGTRAGDPCGAYWENPNIWLQKVPSAANPNPSPTWTASAGVPYIVCVQVFNNGEVDLTNVTAEAWVCDFTMGIGPGSALASSGLLGFITQPTIPGGNSVVIQSGPWTPAASDVNVNPIPNSGAPGGHEGHVCIAVNVFSNQGQSVDGQSIANPPLGQVALPIEPCCNCHQGQRNILVDAQVTGNRKPISSGHVFAFNHTEKEAEFVVKMVERQGDKILSPAVLQQWKSGLHGKIPLHPAKTHAKDFGVAGKSVSQCHQARLKIPAKGRVPLTIHAEYHPHEPVGTIHVFEVTQEDAHGGVFGGVTFATVFIP